MCLHGAVDARGRRVAVATVPGLAYHGMKREQQNGTECYAELMLKFIEWTRTRKVVDDPRSAHRKPE